MNCPETLDFKEVNFQNGLLYTVESHDRVAIDGIRELENQGYNVIIIDSLSHAWAGEGIGHER